LQQAVETHGFVRCRGSHIFLDNRITGCGEVVSLMRRPPFTPQEDSWYSFLLEAESIQGHSAGKRIRSIEKSNDTIGNWTLDLPASSIVVSFICWINYAQHIWYIWYLSAILHIEQLERFIFPSLQYLLFILFIKIVGVTICFGHRRPSSGQDAQFLSHQPHYFVPLFLLYWPMLTLGGGVVYSFIALTVEN
jgi:hypothetical protein